jgi:hypothetical protein
VSVPRNQKDLKLDAPQEFSRVPAVPLEELLSPLEVPLPLLMLLLMLLL